MDFGRCGDYLGTCQIKAVLNACLQLVFLGSNQIGSSARAKHFPLHGVTPRHIHWGSRGRFFTAFFGAVSSNVSYIGFYNLTVMLKQQFVIARIYDLHYLVVVNNGSWHSRRAFSTFYGAVQCNVSQGGFYSFPLVLKLHKYAALAIAASAHNLHYLVVVDGVAFFFFL